MNFSPRIYKINKSHRLLVNINAIDEICKTIIKMSSLKIIPNFKLESDDYQFNYDKTNDITTFLYHYKTEETVSDWVDFLPKNLTDNKDFVQQKISLVFFIAFEDHLYCIIGGNSFRIIQPFLERFFGINIYSRILDPVDDELFSIKTRSISGKIAATSNHYKNNFKLIDHINFGSVPNDISLKLSMNHEYFDFLIDKNKPLQINVSDSIKIKKNINYYDLLKVVKEIKYIEELEKKDYLTTYQKVDDQSLCEKLQGELIKQILEDIPNTLRKTVRPSSKLSIEFCHPKNIDEFYEADYFIISDKQSDDKSVLNKHYKNRDEIFYEVISRAINLFSENITFNELKYYLYGVRIRSYKNDIKKNLSSAMFLHHLNTEFEYKSQTVFLLDNSYYFLKDSFIKDLNVSCE